MRACYLTSRESMRRTVFLFDIDGTLISTGGAGRRSMDGGVRQSSTARAASRRSTFSFAGMTDRAIVRNGLRALEGPDARARASDDAIDRVLDAYLARLADEVARTRGRTASSRGQVGPGLAAGARGGVPSAIGLGTGNVRRGAYAKLARGALDDAFAFGGFGCDAEDRTELLRVGAQRGAAALGAPLEDCRVVVIGDTPKDVARGPRHRRRVHRRRHRRLRTPGAPRSRRASRVRYARARRRARGPPERTSMILERIMLVEDRVARR